MNITDMLSKEDLGEPYVLLTDFLEMSDILKLENRFQGRHIDFRKNIIEEGVFLEIAAALGKDKAMKVSKALSGLPVYFSQLKRAGRLKIQEAVQKDFNGYNYLELAKKYGYTDRHIRNIVKKSGYKIGRRDDSQLSIWDIQ